MENKCKKRTKLQCVPVDYMNNRFTNLQQIGFGGCGNVYSVRDKERKRIMALKIIEIYGADDIETFLSEFYIPHEIEYRLALVYPDKRIKATDLIVRSYEHFTYKDITFPIDDEMQGKYAILQERIEGSHLAELYDLYEEEPDKRDIDSIMASMKILFDHLDILHSIDIILGDISMKNIMIDSKRSKLLFLDFGAACIRPGSKLPVKYKIVETMECLRFDNTYYSAPELLEKRESNNKITDLTKIDVYSLALVFYVLIHGKFPFTRPEQDVSFVKTLQIRLDPNLYIKSTSGNENLDKILDKCLSFKPELRPTAKETVQELNNILND